jgi:hypothetical protein
VRSAFYGAREDAAAVPTAGPCVFHDGRVAGVQIYGD